MNVQKTVIAASIAAIFAASGVAVAKEKWEYNEDKWDDTKSYGNTTIAEDSVSDYGPWKEFAPAAGPSGATPGINFLAASAGEPYRPLPQIPQAPQAAQAAVCGAGDWCGYAVYRNYQWNYNNNNEEYGWTRPYAGVFGLTLQPDDPLTVTLDGGEGPGKVSWRAAALPGNVAPVFGDSGGPMNAEFGDWYYYYGSGGLHNFSAYRYTETASVYDQAWAYGFPHDYYYYWWYLPTDNKEVAAGYFGRYVYDYVSGDGGEYGHYVWGEYVAGIVTPQAYLDTQRAGNVVATYSGNSADAWHGYTSPVNMTVNFGTATWSGSWNGGADGYVYTATGSGNTQYLYGQVGFNASGTISGANIQSTALSANDGTVSGKVQGSFFGQQAGSIGGVHDIVKSKPDVYTNLPNVGVFLVDKVVNGGNDK